MKIPIGNIGDTLLVDGGKSPISMGIKLALKSDWSHVARVLDDTTVELCRMQCKPEIVAKFIHPKGEGVWIGEALGSGYCIRKSGLYANCAWRMRTFKEPITAMETLVLRSWMIDNLGKPYDWRNVLFNFFRRHRPAQTGEKWFCSESQDAQDDAMGREVISRDENRSLIPPHWYAATGVLLTTGYHIRKPEGWPE